MRKQAIRGHGLFIAARAAKRAVLPEPTGRRSRDSIRSARLPPITHTRERGTPPCPVHAEPGVIAPPRPEEPPQHRERCRHRNRDQYRCSQHGAPPVRRRQMLMCVHRDQFLFNPGRMTPPVCSSRTSRAAGRCPPSRLTEVAVRSDLDPGARAGLPAPPDERESWFGCCPTVRGAGPGPLPGGVRLNGDVCGKDEAVQDQDRRNVYRRVGGGAARGVRGSSAADAAGTRPGPGRAFCWSLTAMW